MCHNNFKIVRVGFFLCFEFGKKVSHELLARSLIESEVRGAIFQKLGDITENTNNRATFFRLAVAPIQLQELEDFFALVRDLNADGKNDKIICALEKRGVVFPTTEK